MRPQTCSATSLDTHRRALSRRPAAFFLATWTFLRHDSWAATYVYLHSTTATTATARSAEENFGASRAAAGVDAVVSQLGRGGAPLRFPAVGRKSLSRRTCIVDVPKLKFRRYYKCAHLMIFDRPQGNAGAAPPDRAAKQRRPHRPPREPPKFSSALRAVAVECMSVYVAAQVPSYRAAK